jgi:hypothetical protein
MSKSRKRRANFTAEQKCEFSKFCPGFSLNFVLPRG